MPEESFDFVIVGSGGGSMCAALQIRAMGRTALILEKTDLFGGTTSRSGGMMWIPNNRFMAREGAEDSAEMAMTYLDAAIGDTAGIRSASQARRQAYVEQAPKMMDFLVEQGIKLRRFAGWPDYYDDLPGGSAEGRAVIAELFDANELGPHKAKLRPNYIPMPARLEEAMKVPFAAITLGGKLAMLRVGLRMMTQKLTGKDYVSNGAALQGRMFKRALEAGVDMRLNAPVERLITGAGGAVAGVVARINGEEAEVYRRESLRSDLLRASGSVMFLVVPPQPLEVGRRHQVVEPELNELATLLGEVLMLGDQMPVAAASDGDAEDRRFGHRTRKNGGETIGDGPERGAKSR